MGNAVLSMHDVTSNPAMWKQHAALASDIPRVWVAGMPRGLGLASSAFSLLADRMAQETATQVVNALQRAEQPATAGQSASRSSAMMRDTVWLYRVTSSVAGMPSQQGLLRSTGQVRCRQSICRLRTKLWTRLLQTCSVCSVAKSPLPVIATCTHLHGVSRCSPQ